MLLYKCVDASNHPSFTPTKCFSEVLSACQMDGCEVFILLFLMNQEIAVCDYFLDTLNGLVNILTPQDLILAEWVPTLGIK